MVNTVNFATLMASSVHDMKNIIAAVGQAYESLIAQMPDELRNSPQTRLIEQESLRLDAMLMQLLGLYKLEHEQLRLQCGYYHLDELFEDIHNRHQALLSYRNLELVIELDDSELEGYFDLSLIKTLLDNALGNAVNFAKQQITLQASLHDDGILIQLKDDGPGYPDKLLGHMQQLQSSGINADTGSTGLGLYFASQIVALHHQPDRPAQLKLDNDPDNGGACMQIWLPMPKLFT